MISCPVPLHLRDEQALAAEERLCTTPAGVDVDPERGGQIGAGLQEHRLALQFPQDDVAGEVRRERHPRRPADRP